MEKQQKQRLAGIFILISTIALLTVLSLGKRGFIAQLRIRQENRRISQASEILKAEKERLSIEKQKLEDTEYLEKVAREEYNMAKENEKVLRVVPKEKR